MRAPVYKIHGEDYEYLFEHIRVNGYRRARIDGKPRDLGEHIELDEDGGHTVEAGDRYVRRRPRHRPASRHVAGARPEARRRVARLSHRQAEAARCHKKFYDGFGCARHRLVAGEMQAFQFTFNDPAGACPTCSGIGTAMRVHPSLLVPDPKRTLNEGAFVNAALGNSPDSWGGRLLVQPRGPLRVQPRRPLQELAEEHVADPALWHEGGAVRGRAAAGGEAGQQHAGKKIKFNGVVNQLEHHYRQYRKQGTSNAGMDEYLKKVMVEYDCPECGGARLKRARRLVTIDGRNLYEVGEMHLADLLAVPEVDQADGQAAGHRRDDRARSDHAARAAHRHRARLSQPESPVGDALGR